TRHAREQLRGAGVRFEVTYAAAGCVARADAIRETDDGVELIEVKSGTLSSDAGQKEEYLADIAYTAMVMTAAGTPPVRMTLLLIDPAYRRNAPLPLLGAVDVTAEVAALVPVLAARQAEIAAAVAADAAPPPRFAHHCKACDHFADACL